MTSKTMRPAFLLTMVLATSYVFSGIPFLNYYSYTMLKDANVSDPAYFSFGLQALSFVLMLIAFWLIDRAGRRPLLLISCGGTTLCWPILVVAGLFPHSWAWKPYFVLGIIVLAQVFINIGIKPLIFPIVPELFPMQSRPGSAALGENLPLISSLTWRNESKRNKEKLKLQNKQKYI